MKRPSRILIIRLSSLGDILHACPAFASLRAAFPDAQIDWLVEARTRFLLSGIAGIDEVHVLDTAAVRRAPLRRSAWNRNLQVIRRLRARRYDVAIDFQGLIKTGLLSLLSGAPRRIGFSRSLVRERPASWFYTETLAKPESQLHIVEQNLALARMAGASGQSGPIGLTASDADNALVDGMLSTEEIADFIVINPGGGWYTKRWNPVQYGSLARRIRAELGLQVVVTTGPGEDPLSEDVRLGAGDAKIHTLQLGFMQLIPLYRRARLVIGGDTGPFHLACALGTPVVGIFGPTAPVRNGPWSSTDESVVRQLPCSFCNGRTCPTHNECMDIPVEDVFQAVRRRLERQDVRK